MRNIRKQKVSFLSIIIIAIMGVTAFLGIDYTATAVRRNGSDIYNRLNFRDIEVISTLLISDEDINDMRKVEGVVDVEAVRQTSAMMTSGQVSESITVVSMTERINLPEIVEGRLPETVSECIVELRTAERTGLKVGDTLTLHDAEGNLAKYIKYGEFTITGIVNLPEHTNKLVPEDPYVLVRSDVFDADNEELGGCYMKAEIVVDKSDGINRFSEEYESIVAEVAERIEKLALTATERRDAAVTGAATKQLDEARILLNNGFDELEAAKAAVRDKLRTAVEIVFRPVEEKQLIKWADVKKADLDDPKETARYLWITENVRVDLSYSPRDVFTAIISSESISEKLLVAIYEYTEKSDAPKKTDGTYDMDVVRAALVERATDYAGDFQALSEGCVAWDEGHDRYIAGLSTYNTISSFGKCKWFVLDMNGNASFVQMTIGSGNFAKLKMTFSLMFVIVGALVIFATVGKMIDEQRTLVGTTKALGFFNREIFTKYLFFGVLATLVGTFFGILLARFFVEPFMIDSFNDYYNFDVSKPIVIPSSTIIAVIAAIVLAAAAVWFACSRLLREPAVRLMQPKTPGVKKTPAKGRKSALSLYSRLILLNMRTDLKRVVVTIVSVAGCCALIIVGITLRSSIYSSIDQQYSEITDYDVLVKYEADVVKDGGKEFSDLFDANGAKYVKILHTSVTYKIKELQSAEIIGGDIEKINEFYHLNDVKTGKPISTTDRGVFITRRMAEYYDFGVGSEFDLTVGTTKSVTVRVAGIYENYVGKTVFMSAAYYERVFEEPFTQNSFLVRFGDAGADSVEKGVKTIEGFDSISESDKDRALLESSMSTMNLIVVLFIFISGVMAGVVLLNLTNMYVMQKKREMTVMRINGFTVREVKNYILRETVVTTILGIILGFAIGSGVAYSIARTMEQVFFQMKRSPDFLSWLIAAALTVLFTVIVNAVALRKIKNLRLTDIA